MIALLLAAKSESSPLSYLFLPLMILGGYFLLIRPQKRRAQRAAAVRTQITVGDEVLTKSGIYGIITALDEDDMWLEVADGHELRMTRGAVHEVTQSVTADHADAADQDDHAHDELES